MLGVGQPHEPARHRDGKHDVVWHRCPEVAWNGEGPGTVKPPKRDMRRGIGKVAAESTRQGKAS